MQEAEAQETPPPSPERANPFQFYYSPPFQFVAFSSPPLVLAGVAFQLGSRVISERRSLNVSSSGCRGRGRKKKKAKTEGGGGKGGGGGGKKKKKPSKNKTGIRQRGVFQSRRWGPCDSPLPAIGQIRRPGAFGLLGRVRGGGRMGARMLRTKPLRGHAGVPLPSGSKKQKTK